MIVDVTLPVLSGHIVTSRLRELRGDSFPMLVITMVRLRKKRGCLTGASELDTRRRELRRLRLRA